MTTELDRIETRLLEKIVTAVRAQRPAIAAQLTDAIRTDPSAVRVHRADDGLIAVRIRGALVLVTHIADLVDGEPVH